MMWVNRPDRSVNRRPVGVDYETALTQAHASGLLL